MWQSHAPPVSKSLPVPVKKRIWSRKRNLQTFGAGGESQKIGKKAHAGRGLETIGEIPIIK
jgi:hypothetical protein